MILAPTLLLNAGSGAAIARPTFSRDFAGEKTLDNGTGPAITFTRASGATFFDADGVLQTAANDAPRFDHDPVTGESRGLLIEEARTNLLLNSATLSTQTITVTAVAHTLSFYGTGEVVLSGAHSATVTGTGAFPTRTSLTFTPSAGSLTLTVTGAVEYAQLEAGAFPTSYIPTTTAAATRAADSAVVTPISSFYNQVEGTLFAEGSIGSTAVAFPRFVELATNIDNRISLVRSTSASTARFTVRNGAVNQADELIVSSLGLGATAKLIVAYKENDFAGTGNGQPVATDTSGTVPTASSLFIGRNNIGSEFIGGHIRKVAYWPKRLSNTLLEQLTT
jgi:hypothetical protein